MFFAYLLCFSAQVKADDGMWLLALLKQNEEELKAMGLKIPIEKLSGEKEGSLSEAVIAFGSGCTGSLVSNTGLILTNYHCSYGAIQQYVGVSNPIIQKGYWAASVGQELPVNGLSIAINKKIQDVTDEVKTHLQSGASQNNAIRDAVAATVNAYQQKYPQYKVVVKPYKNNSLFVLFLQLQYNDVRMVGVPPKDVAKFGGETDNWMWPRQSADFAFFRVYADAKGMPAAYSKNNVPLAVKTYLHISKDGYKKGDFAMSMGYPMQSDRNATSMQIAEKTQALNTPMIAVRKLRQSILEEEMNKNPLVKQTYAEKYATSANYCKNAVGMNFWVNQLNVIEKKEAFERDWLNWVMQDETKRDRYANTFTDLRKELDVNAKYKRAQTYYSESFSAACEIIGFMDAFGKSFTGFAEEVKTKPSRYKDLANTADHYYKSFNIDVDRKVTKAVLKLLKDSLSQDLLPAIFSVNNLSTAEAIDKYVDRVFERSVFGDPFKLQNWLRNPSTRLENDPGIQLTESIKQKQWEIFKTTQAHADKANKIIFSFYSSVSDFKDGRYYPDADKTIRLSYGTVSDLTLSDKTIPYQTTLSSLVAKVDPSNKDFQLNKTLQDIWQKNDFANYGKNDDMPVCFITNGDVTGGNSGSPMMNAEGKIIGLVFDCNWESMTREFNYEPNLHKVICVDIRYVLLITEKFSGSSRITGEIERANNFDKVVNVIASSH